MRQCHIILVVNAVVNVLLHQYIIYTERVSRYLEEYYERFREWKLELCNSRRVLSDLKEEFSREDNETMKVEKLKKVEQEEKIMEEFL